ncbi:MAG: glycosyltransferase family 2 protein [Bacteroidota bacterium]
MSHIPTVSILMPVYNGQEYLRPAIDSILAQTYDDFELLIVNDGSKDDSQKIIESYKDPRIVLINQKNQGVARSLNNGLEVARGKYVRRHDADDISTPDSLQKQIDFLEAHPDYVMVCNQQSFMTSSGKVAPNFRLPHNTYFDGKDFRDLSFDDFSTNTSSPVVHGTACYRREDVIKLGKYRPEFIVSEDNDLWLRLLEKNKIAILSQCTYYMRIHGESATARYSHKIAHFRNLLLEFSNDRRKTGTDPLMRGEEITPSPEEPKFVEEPKEPKGSRNRDDLRYMYNLAVNAKDYKLARKYASEVISDGWKLPGNWKMLIFPIIGKKFVNMGVGLKSAFRSNGEKAAQ